MHRLSHNTPVVIIIIIPIYKRVLPLKCNQALTKILFSPCRSLTNRETEKQKAAFTKGESRFSDLPLQKKVRAGEREPLFGFNTS